MRPGIPRVNQTLKINRRLRRRGDIKKDFTYFIFILFCKLWCLTIKFVSI